VIQQELFAGMERMQIPGCATSDAAFDYAYRWWPQRSVDCHRGRQLDFQAWDPL